MVSMRVLVLSQKFWRQVATGANYEIIPPSLNAEAARGRDDDLSAAARGGLIC